MTKLHVPDMSCGHCTAAIEKAIGNLDAKAVVSTDLETKTVEIISSLSKDVILQTLADEGYPATAA
jgi:copper chaperone